MLFDLKHCLPDYFNAKANHNYCVIRSFLRNLIPTIKSQINQSVLPIKPAISQTGKPGMTVANSSACATR